MTLGLTADEVLTTTRTVRKRLDFDRPVAPELLRECLEIALQAPSASNRQAWHWVVVQDQVAKEAIAEIYATNYWEYRAKPRPTFEEGDTRAERASRVSDSSAYLAENMARAPYLVIPAVWGRLEQADLATAAGGWGSILPAMWSLMLALRARGLGSAWTTLHLANGGDTKVSELLGLPEDKLTQAGLLPVAYTKGTDFRPAKRQPLEEVLHWDRW